MQEIKKRNKNAMWIPVLILAVLLGLAFIQGGLTDAWAEAEPCSFEIRLSSDTTQAIPEEGLKYNMGDKAGTLQVVCTSETKPTTLKYKWRKASTQEGALGSAGSTNQTKKETYKPAIAKGINWYACEVTYTVDGQSYTVTTARVKVTVDVTQEYVNKKKPVINEQPAGGSWKYGSEEAILTAEIAGTEEVTITWYISSDEGSTWQETSSGDYSGKIQVLGPMLFLQELPVGEYQFKYIVTYSEENLAGETLSVSTESEIAAVTIELQEGIWEGEGIETSPYLIKNKDDLKKLSDLASQSSFKDKYFKFADEIDGEKGISLPENWKPIGTKDKPFAGTIDGNNKKLVVPKGEKALIGVPFGASLKNLSIYGEEIKGNGVVNNYSLTGVSGEAIRIEKVTLLSGTHTELSGFVGGYASGSYTVTLIDCTVQQGVVIGDGEKCNIGSFGGEFNGTMQNCKSAAVVNGKDFVGGIVGNKGQSMGTFKIENCEFSGTVNASGKYVGGIAGSGYGGTVFGFGSAGNTPMVTISRCKVSGDINAGNYAGGILGAEACLVQCWENGAGNIDNNLFIGSLNCEGDCKGAIIGFMGSLNRYTNIYNNAYKAECGAKKGIGCIRIIDTDSKTAAKDTSEVIYLDSSSGKSISKFPESIKMTDYVIYEKDERFTNYSIRSNHQRSDDPLGADAAKLTRKATEEEISTGKLDVAPYKLLIDGDYKTTYYIGQALDLSAAEFTVEMTDGSSRKLSTAEAAAVAASAAGFDSSKRAVQTVTLSYGGIKTTIKVTVLYQNTGEKGMYVFFTLFGDDEHPNGEATELGGPHTLAGNNLKLWISERKVPIDNNTTVRKVLEDVLRAEEYVIRNESGNYVQGITKKGAAKELAEFTNGKLSGWMYTLNGHHSELGVDQQFLNHEDKIIFHYTDDYTVEEGSEHWNTPGGGVVEEVKNVTTDTKTKATTAPTEVKVSEKTSADGTKTKVADVKVSADNQKEILKQVKEKKSNEIILVVPSKEVGDATKADVMIEKSFIDSIVKDTDAKLTIRTPFGEKTYTQEELKAMSEAATGSTITVAIEKAEEPTDDNAANIAKAKSITKDMKLVARSGKTAKKNIKVVLKSDAKVKASIKELKDLGFTVKYRFYRSTKKAASYKSTVTKKTASYTNTSGKKGTKYFYKVQVRVYDENGKLIAKTALKQCKYASRTWGK